MFDISLTLLSQLIDLLPGLIALFLIFEFIRSLLFNK